MVRVLTAEARTLEDAVHRVIGGQGLPHDALRVLDVGYGTGRVTNQFLKKYHHMLRKDLRVSGSGQDADGRSVPLPSLEVFAYDISLVGLKRAERSLLDSEKGFRPRVASPEHLAGESRNVRVVSKLSVPVSGRVVSITFIQGHEEAEPETVRDELYSIVGESVAVTTSWYSFLGHIPLRERRHRYFEALSSLTAAEGEIVLAVAATGDLTEEQRAAESQVGSGAGRGVLFETPQDLTYVTELGQRNFWHVFGQDLDAHLQEITPDGRHWWVEAIRAPGDEFRSRDEERRNFDQVLAFNRAKRKSGNLRWTADEYSAFHTVVARQSALPPDVTTEPYWDLRMRPADRRHRGR